jgi:hypothetical protein
MELRAHIARNSDRRERGIRMAYDQELDARVASIALPWGATRKTMFGGTAYMINGHLMGGVYKQRLLVRLSASDGADALSEPDTSPFDMMPRPMPGWVTIGPKGSAGKGLQAWLNRGREYAESLPPK